MSPSIEPFEVCPATVLKDLGTGHLLRGGGGVTKREERGHVKFYPYEKRGGTENVLAMLKGGHKLFWGSFYVVA